MNLLADIVNTLQRGESLPPKNKDHSLTSNWASYRECHITPDWLLVHQIAENKLILLLTRAGSHSDLNLY